MGRHTPPQSFLLQMSFTPTVSIWSSAVKTNGVSVFICLTVFVLSGSICGEAESLSALFPIRQNGNRGYIDQRGRIVIRPQWAWRKLGKLGAALPTRQKLCDPTSFLYWKLEFDRLLGLPNHKGGVQNSELPLIFLWYSSFLLFPGRLCSALTGNATHYNPSRHADRIEASCGLPSCI